MRYNKKCRVKVWKSLETPNYLELGCAPYHINLNQDVIFYDHNFQELGTSEIEALGMTSMEKDNLLLEMDIIATNLFNVVNPEVWLPNFRRGFRTGKAKKNKPRVVSALECFMLVEEGVNATTTCEEVMSRYEHGVNCIEGVENFIVIDYKCEGNNLKEIEFRVDFPSNLVNGLINRLH